MEKGKTPKGRMSCRSSLGHAVKSCMTVIRVSDGALSEDIPTGTFAGAYHAGVYVVQKPHEGGRKEKKWQYLREQAWLLSHP